ADACRGRFPNHLAGSRSGLSTRVATCFQLRTDRGNALGQESAPWRASLCSFATYRASAHLRFRPAPDRRTRSALHASPNRGSRRPPWDLEMNEIAAPVKGTRPEGAVNELDASRKVREMFTQIAPRYDLLNHLLSFELDRLWRARAAKCLRPILKRPDAVVLDLCCGTGDLALALGNAGEARILGADFAHTMLVRARLKIQLAPRHSGWPPRVPVPFFEADALCLPFADASFDLVTSAFGFRNLANYEAGLGEIYRVLKPGGTIAILEFAEPPQGF